MVVDNKLVLKINKSDDNDYGDFKLKYKKELNEIKDISLEILNKEGDKVKELKQKKIKYLSLIDGYFYNGYRYKYFELHYDKYTYMLV